MAKKREFSRLTDSRRTAVEIYMQVAGIMNDLEHDKFYNDVEAHNLLVELAEEAKAIGFKLVIPTVEEIRERHKQARIDTTLQEDDAYSTSYENSQIC